MKKITMYLVAGMMVLSLAACSPTKVETTTAAAGTTESTASAETSAADEKTTAPGETPADDESTVEEETSKVETTPAEVIETEAKKAEGPGAKPLETTMIPRNEGITASEGEPQVGIALYRANDYQDGLTQDMEAVFAMTPQNLLDMLAQYGTIQTGIKVNSYSEKDSVATMDLSAAPKGASENLVKAAIANTITANMEVQAVTITVNGTPWQSNLEFVDNYISID